MIFFFFFFCGLALLNRCSISLWPDNALSDFIVSCKTFGLYARCDARDGSNNLQLISLLSMFSSTQRRRSSTNNFPSCPLSFCLTLVLWGIKSTQIKSKQLLIPVYPCFTVWSADQHRGVPQRRITFMAAIAKVHLSKAHTTPLCCRAPLDLLTSVHCPS